MKTLKDKIDNNKQEAARAAFSGYVQSVAFNMTLSRNMVDALVAVRDFGGCWGAKQAGTVNQHVGSHSAPLMGALIRRGLVWHDWVQSAPAGHIYFKLTRPGELMCELLAEAGLIAAQGKTSKRQTA